MTAPSAPAEVPAEFIAAWKAYYHCDQDGHDCSAEVVLSWNENWSDAAFFRAGQSAAEKELQRVGYQSARLQERLSEELVENAKLRAVVEAAKNWATATPVYGSRKKDKQMLRAALAALDAPVALEGLRPEAKP
jgi:hypothetical protein